jgi:AraC family transcriptional regulator
MSEQPKQPPGPLIPCSAALAAMGVPARRWATRADLLKQLQRAEEHLNTAPLDELSLESASVAAGLSLHHFLRLFREVHGITPHRYITRRRMEEAKRLLKETELSVGQIAVEVGLPNQSSFSRLFRAHAAVPPLVYRLTHRSNA